MLLLKKTYPDRSKIKMKKKRKGFNLGAKSKKEKLNFYLTEK